MARTLAEIDADLTKVENRVTNLINAGQALTARLDAAEARLDQLATAGGNLKDRVDRIVETGQEASDQIRRQFRTIRRGAHVLKTEIVTLTAKVNGEPEPPVRPGRNPLIKKMLVRGKLVARSRVSG